MSDFYGKRFLSSLVGALTVLGSPVASARDDKLGKGNLKGRGGASAGRSENGGKLGGLESNRKVKGVESLKKVFKETGGKVVGVSPDGKGGFVAFIKTPTGKVVTVAIVSVPLAVIIYCLVCFGRKNGEGIEGSNISIKESEKIITLGGPVEYIKAEENIKSKGNKKMTVFEGTNGSVGDDQLKYSGKLLKEVFDNQGEYDLFVDRLLGDFFNDELGAVRKQFNDCEKNLDRFLEAVFRKSSFGVNFHVWEIEDFKFKVYILFGKLTRSVKLDGSPDGFFGFFGAVLNYLVAERIVKLPEDYFKDASWGDRISAVLFGFWCSVKYNLGFDSSKLNKVVEAQENLVGLKNAFRTISDYVKKRLEAAGKGYDGQVLKKVN